jgi:hypothetical protein
VSDAELEAFRRDLMPDGVQADVEQLRIVRDIFAKLCAVTQGGTPEDWAALGEVHRLLCPRPAAPARPLAWAPPEVAPRAGPAPTSPWAGTDATREGRGALEPHAELAMTAAAVAVRSPALPFVDKKATPPPRGSLEPEGDGIVGGFTAPIDDATMEGPATPFDVVVHGMTLAGYARHCARGAATNRSEDAELHTAWSAEFTRSPALREAWLRLYRAARSNGPGDDQDYPYNRSD